MPELWYYGVAINFLHRAVGLPLEQKIDAHPVLCIDEGA